AGRTGATYRPAGGRDQTLPPGAGRKIECAGCRRGIIQEISTKREGRRPWCAALFNCQGRISPAGLSQSGRLVFGPVFNSLRTDRAGDLDLLRLHMLGHFTPEIDIQKTVLKACAQDLDGLGQPEAAFESSARNTAIEIIALL